MYQYFTQLTDTAYSIMTAFVPGRGSETDEKLSEIKAVVGNRELWVNNYKGSQY